MQFCLGALLSFSYSSLSLSLSFSEILLSFCNDQNKIFNENTSLQKGQFASSLTRIFVSKQDLSMTQLYILLSPNKSKQSCMTFACKYFPDDFLWRQSFNFSVSLYSILISLNIKSLNTLGIYYLMN